MSLQPDGLSTVPLPDFNGAEQPADVDWRVIAENRDRELRAVGEARYKAERERDSLARRLNERYQQLGEARTALHRVTEEVAGARAAALHDFAASMRALAEQAPEGEPASWPWSAYALAAVKAEEHAGKGFPSGAADRTPDVGTSDAVGPHRCPSCDKPTQYQSFSGGREWYCPNCGNNGSYPDGAAPGRAGLLTTPEGREQLRVEVRDELARRSVPSLPEETPDA